MNLRDVLKKGQYILSQAQIENANGDAFALLELVFSVDQASYLLQQEEEADEETVEEYKNLLLRRADHVPLQYLTGIQNFLGYDFKVNSSVLIPRYDTEVLVDQVRRYLRPGMHFLDLCTGSGCIGITLKKECPKTEGTASDLSKAALLVAKENARNLGADLEFICSDLFDKIKGEFDVIVSNPPYIPEAVIPTLDAEVRDFEPVDALVGGPDGLDFYRRIIEDAREHLKTMGKMFFEIGYDQGEDVKKLMEKFGYKDVVISKDLAGLDRIVSGIWPGES